MRKVPYYQKGRIGKPVGRLRRFFLFVWVLSIEKLGVCMTDKGGFL